MIRINLLASSAKPRAKKAVRRIGLAGQKLTIGCGLILVAGAAVHRLALLGDPAGLRPRSTREIVAAQQETTRLHSVLQQVQQFEQRKAQLQQRVVLIEQLRKDQTGPVHMLDQISRALPPMLWLTELKQSLTGDDVVIDGRCTDADRPVRFRRQPRSVGLLQAIGRDRQHPARDVADRRAS